MFDNNVVNNNQSNNKLPNTGSALPNGASTVFGLVLSSIGSLFVGKKSKRK